MERPCRLHAGVRFVRNDWTEEEMLKREEQPRERDGDSSVQSQYEDSVLPDREWEHEGDS